MTQETTRELFVTDDQWIDVAGHDQALRLDIVRMVIDSFGPSDEFQTVAKAKTLYDWVSANRVKAASK